MSEHDPRSGALPAARGAWLTREEAAALMGVTGQRISQLVRQGRVAAIRVGRLVYVDSADVVAERNRGDARAPIHGAWASIAPARLDAIARRLHKAGQPDAILRAAVRRVLLETDDVLSRLGADEVKREPILAPLEAAAQVKDAYGRWVATADVDRIAYLVRVALDARYTPTAVRALFGATESES